MNPHPAPKMPDNLPPKERYVVVSDIPEYTVYDTEKKHDLFPTSSGNRRYACLGCSREVAEKIARALNTIEAVKDSPASLKSSHLAEHAPSLDDALGLPKGSFAEHVRRQNKPPVPAQGGEVTCNPPLDCDRETLVAYINSMSDGERVVVLGECCEKGMQGTVVTVNDSICIKLDPYPSGGQMTVSFLGGARRLTDVFPNVPDAQKPPAVDSPREVPSKLFDKLSADIADRRGIKWEWEKIDPETMQDIRKTWERFFREELSLPAPCTTEITVCLHHHREEVGDLEERLKHLVGVVKGAARIVRRLVRYADKVAVNHPAAITPAGQNARVEGAAWLAKHDPEEPKG